MEPFIGEIRMFAGNFAPQNWALCDGKLLQIAQNEVLFSLLGTTFGGDGQITFGLPDLRGRAPLHVSPEYAIAQAGGQEQVTLTQANFPQHTHEFHAVATTESTETSPEGGFLAGAADPMYTNAPPNVDMHASMIGAPVGLDGEPYGQASPLPHDNMQPFVAINFIIALWGVYPTQD